MFLVKDWEMFYTDSLFDEDLVDQISVDVANKRYIIDVDADICVTDGCDEEGNEVYSHYVSRFIFDLILDGIRQRGLDEIG